MITNARRNAAREFLNDSSAYEPDTMRITRDGVVTACKSADKRPGCDSARYDVAHINDICDTNGVRVA
jgi:hypothetical protein